MKRLKAVQNLQEPPKNKLTSSSIHDSFDLDVLNFSFFLFLFFSFIMIRSDRWHTTKKEGISLSLLPKRKFKFGTMKMEKYFQIFFLILFF